MRPSPACANCRRALYTEVLDNGRLFGYMQAGQELRLLKKSQWVMRHTAVQGGNMYAVLS